MSIGLYKGSTSPTPLQRMTGKVTIPIASNIEVGASRPDNTTITINENGILSAVPLTKVKGNAETVYRTGNVNLTPSDLGAATAEQGKAADTAVQEITFANNDGTTYSGTTVMLPAYPTSLPASDVASWAKELTKPSYTYDEVGAASEAQGALADSAVQSIKIGTDNTEYNINNNVILPAYPTTLPASDVFEWAKATEKPTYTYTEVGAASAAQGTKADSAIQSIKISGNNTEYNIDTNVVLPAYPTTLPASDVYSWAKTETKPSYTYDEVGAASSSHTHSKEDIISVNASAIVGTISENNLPKSALERLSIVNDDTSRFNLTIDDIQLGDTVKVQSTGKMYFVKDTTKLNTENGYEPYTAASASSVVWTGVTNTPTTLSGYGITDAATATQGTKADSAVQTIKLGATSYTGTTIELPAYPTTLPASDVYSWAKASSKPSYTASEVGALSSSTLYAQSATAGGSATSAVKLDTNAAGSSTTPIYWKDGKPAACSYSLNKTVPSDALFTDTNTTYSFSVSGNTLTITPSSGNTTTFTPSFSITAHRSTTGSTYGQATASYFGHAKLSDTYTSSVSGANAAGGVAASQNALYNAYHALEQRIAALETLIAPLDGKTVLVA